MGACLSCLRDRNSSKNASRGRADESQPLLDDSNDMYGGQFGAADGQADQQAQRRQQELSQVVQTTHEYFIDASSMLHPENTEAPTDYSALRERLSARAAAMKPSLPKLMDLSAEEQETLRAGVAEVEADRQRQASA